MTVEEALCYGKEKIHSDFAKLLLSDLLGKNPLELYLCLDDIVPEVLLVQYKKEVDALQEGTPIQYAIGHVNFFGKKFYVNKNVLIPRFETEELVEKTLDYVKQIWEEAPSLQVLDLGCGSGVIGLTLKDKMPTLAVTLLDISKEALEVAKKNKEALGLSVRLVQGDMLENLGDEKYDVLISNPPYLKEDEEIEDIVKKNEPHIALYGGKDGLYYYRKILEKAKEHLNDSFLIAFEIGCNQKDAITQLAQTYLEGIQIECLKDLQGRERMLFIFRKM